MLKEYNLTQLWTEWRISSVLVGLHSWIKFMYRRPMMLIYWLIWILFCHVKDMSIAVIHWEKSDDWLRFLLEYNTCSVVALEGSKSISFSSSLFLTSLGLKSLTLDQITSIASNVLYIEMTYVAVVRKCHFSTAYTTFTTRILLYIFLRLCCGQLPTKANYSCSQIQNQRWF